MAKKKTFKLRVIVTTHVERTYFIDASSKEKAEALANDNNYDEVDLEKDYHYPNEDVEILNTETLD